MQKIRIIGVKQIISDLIAELHELGMVEIISDEFDNIESGRALENYDLVSKHLVFVRGLKNFLEAKKSEEKKLGSDIEFSAEFDSLAIYLSQFEQFKNMNFDDLKSLLLDYIQSGLNISELSLQIAELKKRVHTLNTLSQFDVDYSKLKTNHTDYVIGGISSTDLSILKEKLDKKKKPYNLLYSGNTALFVYSKEFEDISHLLVNFNQIEVPAGLSGARAARSAMLSDITAKESLILELEQKVNNSLSKTLSFTSQILQFLTIQADRSEIAARFGFTNSVFVISGWIPKKDTTDLESRLKKYEKIYIEHVEPSHHDNPPIVLDNPKQYSPLEFLTRNYSLPSYNEFDPTFIYFITVPILYGMIVGDVFYGIISVFIGRFFLEKFKSSTIMSNVSRIWIYGALPTIIFGILFDEWMGMSHKEFLNIFASWGLFPELTVPMYSPWIHRLHDLGLLLGVTALVGLIHLGMGFILGFVNERDHNKKHALAKLCWLGVEIGGAVFVMASLLNVLPVELGIPSIVLFLASAIGLFFTEGVIGILEIPGFAGNVFSYMRIAVIGVVGVIIAEVINTIFSPSASSGLAIILILPLFIILHTINAFIAMFESLIQGGRLNLVEFKMKFMKGGGKTFEPFALSQKNLR